MIETKLDLAAGAKLVSEAFKRGEFDESRGAGMISTQVHYLTLFWIRPSAPVGSPDRYEPLTLLVERPEFIWDREVTEKPST